MDFSFLTQTKFFDWIQVLQARNPLPALVPNDEWDQDLSIEIQQGGQQEISKMDPTYSVNQTNAILAGLLLWNDALESSHALSQSNPTQTGSYWHGIMHRREPDFGNSAYWFNRVGSHPAFNDLKHLVVCLLTEESTEYSHQWSEKLQTAGWDPFDFIARCEKAMLGKTSHHDIHLLEKIQLLEIENLLMYSFKNKI